MPGFNGSGTFVRTHNWVTDKANTVKVTASRMDTEDDGFATGLSTAICKDGQTTTTAAIPFAVGINISDGTAATPAIKFTNDTDCGWYRIGANNVGLSIGGSLVWDYGTATASAAGSLVVGGTLAVTGGVTAATATVSVFAATGAATFASTVGITGQLTAATATVSVFAATGAATLASTLGVTGAATLSSTLAVTGDVAVNTNKFNITAASGNTTIAGTLGVTGATTLSSTLGVTGALTASSTTDVTGNFNVNTNKFSVVAASGNTTIAGTLGITGATTLTGGVGAVASTGAVTSSSSSAGIGYATGAGGTVTQITSKSTGVTLNAICGQITTHNALIPNDSTATFTLTNSAIAANDTIFACIKSGATANAGGIPYQITVSAVAAGSCNISINNGTNANSPTDTLVISFVVIKAVAA